MAPLPAVAPASGDGLVQSYNYRLCLSNASDRLPFAPPANYTPAAMEVLRRWWAAQPPALAASHTLDSLFLLRYIPPGADKIDVNQGAMPMGADAPFLQAGYPLGDGAARARSENRDFVVTDDGLD